MLVHHTFEESFVLNSYLNFLCITNYANRLSKSERVYLLHNSIRFSDICTSLGFEFMGNNYKNYH